MNKPVTPTDLVTPKVTTGPLPPSRNAYSSPAPAAAHQLPRATVQSTGGSVP